jgi:hypothetical protein
MENPENAVIVNKENADKLTNMIIDSNKSLFDDKSEYEIYLIKTITHSLSTLESSSGRAPVLKWLKYVVLELETETNSKLH